MEREPVRSSSIASIGYDPYERILEVEFHNRLIYQYIDVPEKEYRALFYADSIGSYINFNIRDLYDYRVVNDGS